MGYVPPGRVAPSLLQILNLEMHPILEGKKKPIYFNGIRMVKVLLQEASSLLVGG